VRLIDADALRDEAYFIAAFDYSAHEIIDVGDLDAAPTISCYDCVAFGSCSVPVAYREHWKDGGPLPREVGCSNFERRQP